VKKGLKEPLLRKRYFWGKVFEEDGGKRVEFGMKLGHLDIPSCY
jgi:hypothetical protein